MNRHMEAAFADEVLAELGAQKSRGLTAKEVQRRTGITSSTWGNYFVQRTTRIPLGAMLDVCDALDVLPEEMIRRARVRAARVASESGFDQGTAMLEGRLTPKGREAVEEGRRAVRDAEGDAVDPPMPTVERTRRSA